VFQGADILNSWIFKDIENIVIRIKEIVRIAIGVIISVISSVFSSATPIQFGQNQCNLVVDTQTKTEPNFSKPGYLQPYTDPVFGTKVTRITGDPGTAIPIVGGAWSFVSRPGYENRPVWNADQTILLIERTGVGNLFLDGNTYKPLYAKTAGPFYSADARWHPTIPSKMLYAGNNKQGTACEFGLWDVNTNAITVQKTLSGYTGCTLGGTGNWSKDASRVAVDATRASDGKNVVFAVDLTTGNKYPDIDVVAKGFVDSTSIDWVSISPFGDLIYVNGGLSSGTNQNDNTMVFDLAGNVVQTWLQYGSPSHGDLSVDASGNEIIVGVDKSSTYLGKVIMRNLRTGLRTPLDSGGFVTIVSTRNNLLANWAFVNDTGFASPNNWPPYNDDIFAVALDGSRTVPRLAHAHNANVNYDAQGFVVPSPDGLRFVFASDWNNSSGVPVQTYVVDMRPLCSTKAPTASPQS
jgi:hypothetical protein